MSGASGGLSTHVLDTGRGRPAAGMRIDVFRLDGERRALLRTVHTNADGRTDELLIPRGTLRRGSYELLFYVGAYFHEGSDPPFLDQVPLRFGVADEDAHHHVPLLVSPWSYSTYRGS